MAPLQFREYCGIGTVTLGQFDICFVTNFFLHIFFRIQKLNCCFDSSFSHYPKDPNLTMANDTGECEWLSGQITGTLDMLAATGLEMPPPQMIGVKWNLWALS